MKIYEYKPVEFIRLDIHRIGEGRKYLTLVDTDKERVIEMIEQVVRSQNISPFASGHKTKIVVREAVGGENGKSKSVSFYGLSAEETYDLIVKYVTSKNQQ